MIRDFPEKDAACGVGGDGPYGVEITVILVVIEGKTNESTERMISRRNRFSFPTPGQDPQQYSRLVTRKVISQPYVSLWPVADNKPSYEQISSRGAPTEESFIAPSEDWAGSWALTMEVKERGSQ